MSTRRSSVARARTNRFANSRPTTGGTPLPRKSKRPTGTTGTVLPKNLAGPTSTAKGIAAMSGLPALTSAGKSPKSKTGAPRASAVGIARASVNSRINRPKSRTGAVTTQRSVRGGMQIQRAPGKPGFSKRGRS
jgi:hypothetical protein